MNSASQPAAATETHAVQCLEVWGGTTGVKTTLSLPGIDAWVFSEPYQGDDAGGDIHYVSSCFTGRVTRFALADVAGHGASASDLSGKLRKLMRKHINYLDQTGLARVLNTEFAALSKAGRFATALLMSYFAPTDHLIVCNAGHPTPLWYDAAQKSWRLLRHDIPDSESRGPNNLPLGIIDPTDYVQFTVRLGPGDFVLLYTDSLTEARLGGTGPLLGEEGFLQKVRSLPLGTPEELGRRILASISEYRGGTPSDDDQTLIVFHHNATEPKQAPVRNSIRYIADLLGLAGD
jgi:sigma-B regulation protein RsbU (phosphoserine phosphatase)